MKAVEFSFFFANFSVLLAWWCRREMPQFAKRINQQVYEEYCSLLEPSHSAAYFFAHSTLQPKQTAWTHSFWVMFPLLAYVAPSPWLAVLLMILLFLALLDYCYYLTDVRYVALIFVLALVESAGAPNSLLFTVLLFGALTLFYRYVLHKEALGMGDCLLFVALSPLFEVAAMCLLIFTAATSGLLFCLLYWTLTRKKMTKLPFVPFMALSTFGLIIAKIQPPF